MIKAIFFDIGDVLIHNSFNEVLQGIAENLGVGLETLKRLREEYNQELTTGEMSVFSFSKILKEKFNLNISPEEIVLVWDKVYKEIRIVNEELFNFAKELSKKYRVGIISNIYDLTAKIDRERGLCDPFDPCILSCEVGLKKPEKEIFKLALKKLNFKGDECVFIDNRETHLIEPNKLGFKTILFKNNEQVIEDLNKLLESE